VPDEQSTDTDKARADSTSTEAENAGANPGADDSKTDEPKPEGEKTTFTKDDVRRESDRAVSNAHKDWKAKADAAVEEAKAEAAAEHLKKEGKFEELYEIERKRSETLEARAKDQEFREQSAEALREAGVEQFGAVLLAPRETPADVANLGVGLKKLFEEAVQSEVLKRLDTGTAAPKKAGATPAPKLADLKTVKAKVAFVEERGEEAYKKVVAASSAP